MDALAFWLAFLGALPIAYWLLRLLFDSFLSLFMPRHEVTIEVEQKDGSWLSTKVDVTNDEAFYKASMMAIRGNDYHEPK